jgi:hypothetical protein
MDKELGGEAMKRALLVMFVVSLISIPLFGADRGVHQSAALTNVRALSLEHAVGSWRMQIKCDQGVGTISMIDRGQQPVYRGEGCFADWSQEELKATYQSMIPNEAVLELIQLG